MNSPAIIAIVLILSASLGQLNRLFIGSGTDVVLYANDLLAGGLMVAYLGYALVVRKSWRIPPFVLGITLFLFFGLVGLAFSSPLLSDNQLLVSLSYMVRYISYLFLFFVSYDAVVYAAKSEQMNQVFRWVVWVMLAMVLVALSGFIQLYVLPDLAILAQYGWDPHVGRLTTSMLDPNYAAAYMSMGVAVALSVFFYSQRTWLQLVSLAISVVLLIAILLTFSRSGFLMLGIILGVIAVFKSRWLLVIAGVIAIVAFLFIPRIQERVIGAIEIDDSASPRITSWLDAWEIASDNQPFGVGYNSYRYAQDRYGILELEESGNAGAGADSSWLFILATTGWFGFVSFVLAYLSLGFMSFRGVLFGHTALIQAVSLAFLGILAGLAVFSQFNNALFYTWIIEVFWLLAGLVVGFNQMSMSATGSKQEDGF